MGAMSLCRQSGCPNAPKTRLGFCSRSCAQKGRRHTERRVTCARDGCSRQVGERQVKYCSRDCKKIADRYTGACMDCGFPIHRNSLRCLSCEHIRRVNNPSFRPMDPEVREKMRQSALDRYATRRGGVRWTEEVCAEIRKRYEAGERQAALARAYRAGQSTIWAIVTFGSWAGYREFKKRQGAC